MTQEDKQLLLVDLCARLPFGIKGYLSGLQVRIKILGVNGDYVFYKIFTQVLSEHIRYVKPYLRPMSSMTEEERNDFSLSVSPKGSAIYYNDFIGIPLAHLAQEIPYEYIARIIDWLNAHHFDYRGLIQKGLAISTKEFNPYKD